MPQLESLVPKPPEPTSGYLLDWGGVEAAGEQQLAACKRLFSPGCIAHTMALGAVASSGDLLRQDTLPEGVDTLPTQAVVVGVGTAEAPASVR